MSATIKRKSFWVLVGWTILAAIIAYPIYRHNSAACDSSVLGHEGCAAAGVAPSFWHPFIPIWLIGLVILALSWPIIRRRTRLCPVCGEDVQRGKTACPACGHDFAAAATALGTH